MTDDTPASATLPCGCTVDAEEMRALSYAEVCDGWVATLRDLAAERAAHAETRRQLETYKERSLGFAMQVYPTPYGWTFLSCGTLTDGFTSALDAATAGTQVLLETIRDIFNPVYLAVHDDPGDEQPEDGAA